MAIVEFILTLIFILEITFNAKLSHVKIYRLILISQQVNIILKEENEKVVAIKN